MYDWPEVMPYNDELWRLIREALLRRGFDAPPAIDREVVRETAWLSPDLLIGQTCGLPFVRGVRQKAAVLGTFDYGIEGCDPGDYRSVIVCRRGESRPLPDFEGTRVAYNGRDSQSGHAALVATVAPLVRDRKFFAETIESGAHRRSMQMVADGSADVAAVDVVSWLLALDVEPATDALEVVGSTACTPGLPLITSRTRLADREELNAAIHEATTALSQKAKRALHIHGYVPRLDSDYDVIEQRLAEAVAMGYPQLA